MAFRFFRRLRLAPGLTLNLSKRGGSLSFGPRGAKITAGTSGIRRTVGLPGTGLWYTEKVGADASRGNDRRRRRSTDAAEPSTPPTPTVAPEDRLTLGFFRRLFTPQGEEDFVDGMRCVVTGDERRGYEHLRKAAHLPDAAFMAGMLALRFEQFEQATHYLGEARRRHAGLGQYMDKYGIDAAVTLPITDRISVHAGPSLRSILLALAEAHQGRGAWRDAVRTLQKLREKDPRNPLALLSLVEILIEERGDARACRQVVKLTSDVDNESELHAAILLWKGKALASLGLPTAARDTLTAAFRRKKDRSEQLLQAIRYERALVYEQLGRTTRARQELEKLYAQAPDYADVATRLGL